MSKFLVKWKGKPDSEGMKISSSDMGEAKRLFLKGKQGNEDDLEATLIGDGSVQAEEDRKRKEEEQKKHEEELLLAKQKAYGDISNKLQNGVETLNSEDLRLLSSLVGALTSGEDVDEVERKLAWQALNDPSFVNFIQIKQSSQNLLQQNALLEKLGVQLSKISSNSSSIKTTNLFTGMLAARHLGEGLAEGFGGGDE